MKKLMIAAAVAMLGIAANAASYNWTCMGYAYYNDSSATYTEFDGYGMYLFDLNYLNLSAAEIVSSLSNNGTGILAKALASTTVGNGYEYEFTQTNQITGKGSDPEWINALIVMVDSTEKFFTSQDVSVKVSDAVIAGGADLSTEFAMSTLPAVGADGWTAVAPEPTSGLLLLLGMGALALRRRRA